VEEKTVLDLFLISCETGLRFSDLCELNEKNIHYEQFEVFPKKTRKNNFVNKLIIPFSPRVKRIIEENNKSIPNYQYSKISRFNKIIKELCKKASIDEPSIHYRIVQGKECIVERKKYELVSSHTGRRTFCTLKFLAGMPTHIIMKFSGHSSEQNFLKYLKLDAELTAKKYKDFFN
jgi:integrase